MANKVLLKRVPVKVSGQPVETLKTARQSLAATLYRLGIGVIPTEQVEAFKKRLVRKEKGIIRIFGIAVTLLLFVGGASFYKGWVLFVGSAGLQSVLGLLGFGLILIGCLMLFFATAAAKVFLDVISNPPCWVKVRCGGDINFLSHRFNDFSVPIGALEEAKRIHQELPKASFVVHHFLSCPFLQVVLEEESYYIAHWDEPEFKES